MRASSLWPVIITALLAGGAGWFAASRTAHDHSTAPAQGERRIKFYQSSMHPWITSDQPGQCTICGMELTPVYEGEAGFANDGDLVTLSPASAAVVGVQTTPVRTAPLVRTLRVTGVLDDDETRHRILVARAPGRIETLHVNEVGAEVAGGEPLVTIYSPEVFSAQRTYVERLRAGPSGFTGSERSAARERLLIMGLTEADVQRLETTLEPVSTVTVAAPFAGTIVARRAYAGEYVETDSPLFEIGDLSTLWFIFDAYEADLAWLRVGQTVEVTTPSHPGEVFTAPITFIDPNLNETTRTARVRVVLDNPERRLRHRQTASGHIRIESTDTLLVPRSAVLHTRAEPVVFVEREGGGYEPRTVRTGRPGDTDYEILEGLQPGERVVTQGALLIDGQSRLMGPPPAPDAPATVVNVPAVDHATITPLALAVAVASAALAADDLAGYQAAFPALTSTLPAAGPARDLLAPLSTPLVTGPDLRTARRAFEPFATAVADLARAAGLHHAGVVRVFQCPMTPVLRTGRWLQTTADLRNPYFGAAMLECGEELQ